MVWPTRIRRRTRKHAFEEALEAAELDPEGGGPAAGEPFLTGPAVGSLGGIAVAAGYVAPASLARAYADEGAASPAGPKAAERPADAAARLKAALAAGAPPPSELKRLRRRFAAENHPDRVAPELRAEAVAAMAEVNAAIDRALKRAGRS